MPDRPPCKALLRKELRRQRQGLSPSAQVLAAEAVAHHILQLPRWHTARRVALYLANDGEIDTTPLVTLCRTAGKQLFLPVIDGHNKLAFAQWLEECALVTNRYGIPEPPRQAPRCAVTELDIIILPLVAWDRLGGRLGMGGGFYDRSLVRVESALLVGAAHTFQEVPQVPRDDWDVPLDFVVTDSALHQCGTITDAAPSVLDDDTCL